MTIFEWRKVNVQETMYLTICFESRMFCTFVALASAGRAELGLRSGLLIPLRLERLVRITAVSLWVLGTDLAPGFRSTWGIFYVSVWNGYPRLTPGTFANFAYRFHCSK